MTKQEILDGINKRWGSDYNIDATDPDNLNDNPYGGSHQYSSKADRTMNVFSSNSARGSLELDMEFWDDGFCFLTAEIDFETGEVGYYNGLEDPVEKMPYEEGLDAIWQITMLGDFVVFNDRGELNPT